MTLRFDPAAPQFQAAIRQIPGYPPGEELPIRALVFASNALFDLSQHLTVAGAKREEPLLVVMDETPMQREGAALKPLIIERLRAAGWQPEPIWLEAGGDGQVHSDFDQIGRVQTQLHPTAAVLAVGSGTVTDIAKHACFCYQQAAGVRLPLVVYQTANSVSAYTSNMAPVFVDGVKRTLPSRYPDGLVCDLETLRDAPAAMTVAGVGDLLAALGSYADWWLAHRLGLDAGYSEFAQTLMGPLDEILLAHAGEIQQRSLTGMELLAKLISLAGLAMSLAHSTAPLSGYEHVVSHVLDLCAERQGRPLAAHGAQVGLTTVLTTAAYQQFLDQFDPASVVLARCYPDEAEMQARIVATFAALDPSGRVAAECWSDYRQKLAAWHEQRADFVDLLAAWPAVRRHLRGLAKPPVLARQILHAVGAPLNFAQLTPPLAESEVKFAFLAAPLIRRRLTLGDLLLFLNWDREALWTHVLRQGGRVETRKLITKKGEPACPQPPGRRSGSIA